MARRIMSHLKTLFLRQNLCLLKLYLTEIFLRIKQKGYLSELKEIRTGVPQGSIPSYRYFTPNLESYTITTFVDDSAIQATGEDHEEANPNVS